MEKTMHFKTKPVLIDSRAGFIWIWICYGIEYSSEIVPPFETEEAAIADFESWVAAWA